MATNNKKFIILQEDDVGYGLNQKKPSGYTKIEPKNSKVKIIYYIQNLNNENVYSLNLIVSNDSKVGVISIGESKPDDTGKIDVSYDFDESLINSLCGSSICLKDSNGDVKYPLSGFLPKRKCFNWKVNTMRSIKNRPFRKEKFGFDKKKDNKSLKDIVKDFERSYGVSGIEGETEEKYEKVSEDIRDKVGEITKVEALCECKEEEINSDDVVVEIYEEHKLDKSGKIEGDKFNIEKFPMHIYRNLGYESLLRYDEGEDREMNKQYKHIRDNIYSRYEYEVRCDIESSKELLKEAKEHIQSLKKLILNDDGKIERLLRCAFSSSFKTQNQVEYDYNYRFFLNILSEFEEVPSLNQDNYKFFKVYVENFSQMENVRKIDNIKYGIVYYPMMFMYPYFKDKGYFVVGLNCDGENLSNLVYGIEVDDSDDSGLPYDGKTGFNNYIYDYENSRSYNIMEYDYKEFRVK